MLTIAGPGHPDRRDLLRVGALGVGGLTLADVFRLRAHAAPAAEPAKSVIMVCLTGGPSHIDTYDPKPDAPAEFRGEFGAIRTNLPGLDLCEHLPLQAKIADKLAVVRGLRFRGKHDPYELLSGYPSARSGEVRAVVVWGEFGRTPRIGTEGKTLGAMYAGGRDHWWDAGFAVLAGGGLRTGQVVGETDARAERARGRPYTPQNVLATLYRVPGVDPRATFPDYQGRPVPLLDDPEPIKELL